MLPPVGSVGPYLRLDGPSRQRLYAYRLGRERVALLVPERVLEPVRIVAAVMVGAIVRAARLASRVRGGHRGARLLDEVVEVERLGARGIEHAALVLDLGAGGAIGDLVDFLHSFDQHFRKTENAAVSLHGAANLRAHLGDRFAVLLAVEPRKARLGPLGRILGQVLATRLLAQEFEDRLSARPAQTDQLGDRILTDAVP